MRFLSKWQSAIVESFIERDDGGGSFSKRKSKTRVGISDKKKESAKKTQSYIPGRCRFSENNNEKLRNAKPMLNIHWGVRTTHNPK